MSMTEKENNMDDDKTLFQKDIDAALKVFPYPEKAKDLIKSHLEKLLPLWKKWKEQLQKAKGKFNLDTSSRSIPYALEEITKENIKRTNSKMIIGIVGAAGSGKDTLAKEAGLPKRVLQTTTRNPRPGEKDAVDYESLSEEEFEDEGLFFRTDYKPGRGRYGFRKENIDKALEKGTAYKILMLDG